MTDTTEMPSLDIATSGVECSRDFARYMMETTLDEKIHTVEFLTEPWSDCDTVFHLVSVDGASVVLHCHNGTLEHRREFETPAAAFKTLRASVAAEAERWRRVGGDQWHIEYSPGGITVEFEGVDVEVQD